MTSVTRRQFLQLLKDSDATLTDAFSAMSDKIRSALLRAANTDGAIPLLQWSRLEQQIGALILYLFLSQSGRAYLISSNGTLVGASPYLRLLWATTEQAVKQAVEEQVDILKAKLPPDLVTKAQHAQQNPFLAYALLGDEGDLFKNYLPPYGDVFGDGKTLEDRVHRIAGETRQKVTALLRSLLSEQKTATMIADAMNLFLTGALDDGKPGIGTTAKFDAARLLAGQTTYAYEKARLMGAALSPFTEQVDVVLSPSHRVTDTCDDVAAGSPYDVKDAPVLPLHGSCLCTYRFHSSRNTQAVVGRLKSDPSRLNIQGVLSPGFADLLLRGGLT